MKLHAIQLAYAKLPPSIKNTAEYYPEGRNILIYCLSRNSRRTERQVIEWLKETDKKVKDLDKYEIRNDSDRIK